ncbi:hypothetical protein LTR08_006541 [Meristemomyces frigidus]|nr:hypothetical protein LTR08_006541 [Meristemomyces frigidus]
MSAALTTDVDKRMLRTTKFPPEFNVKVDMTKVNIPVIKKWVSDELAKILSDEDDVVTDLVFNLIEGPRYPQIKELQISLNGFLDKDAPAFCEGLWKLCVSAQENPQGIPKELLEAKKLELLQEKSWTPGRQATTAPSLSLGQSLAVSFSIPAAETQTPQHIFAISLAATAKKACS